jgi:D-aspartate ligase
VKGMIIKQRKFMPVIIGGDINAYSVARAFHEEYQIKSIVVSREKWGPSADSKIIDNIYEQQLEDNKIFVKTLIDIANQKSKKKLILIACSDWYIRLILENKEELSKYYIIPYIDIKLMNKLSRKDSFHKICEKLNIDYPKTFIYDCKQRNKIDLDFNYPVAAKPADSALYHYVSFPGKKKGFKLYNQSELEIIINNLHSANYKGKFLIQDFIPGNDSNMRVLTCYCDKNSKVKFFALGHILLEEHTPGAIGNYAAIINSVNYELFEQARKFLEYVKYVGFAHFDIKYDPRDGKYKFFEINVRLGRGNYHITGSGYNVAKFIVDEYIHGKKIKETIADKEYLYLVIPKVVLFKYLKDKALRKKAKQLIRTKKVCNPLLYRGENNFNRIFYVHANLLKHIQKYVKYYKPAEEGMRREKIVGVIGGIGPLATACFMKKVIDMTEANIDQEHINMIIMNHATIPDRTSYLLNKSDKNPGIIMAEDAKRLEQMGVSFIVIPCNTSFAFFKEIQKKVKIPVINLIEETILYIIRNNPNIKKVGLLGTDGTVKTNLYQKIMEKYGVKCVIPSEEKQNDIMKILYDQIKAAKPIDMKLLIKVIKELEDKGCEKIILGCTELSIINEDNNLRNDKIVDTLNVLALKTITLSGKKIKIDKKE